MNKIKFLIPGLVFLLIVFLPMSASAIIRTIGGLVPCTDTCNYEYFIKLIGNVINFFIFDLAVPIATIAIVYAGIMMVTHPADEGKRKQAKEILMTAIWGLVIALSAYLIVKTILGYFLNSDIQSKIPIDFNK